MTGIEPVPGRTAGDTKGTLQGQVGEGERGGFDLAGHAEVAPEHLASDLNAQAGEVQVLRLGVVFYQLGLELVQGVLADVRDIVLIGFADVQVVE